IVTDSSARRSTAAPLKRPWGTASTTVPEASAPLGTTTFPPTSTGVATLELKWSPEWLNLDPTALARRTVMTVPAGSVISFLPNRLDDLSGAPAPEASSNGDGLVEQPIDMQNASNEATIAKRRCTTTS